MNNENYNIQGLVENESFIAWVLNPMSDIDGYWEKYLKNNSDQLSAIQDAKKIVQQLNEAKNTPSNTQKTQILQSIHSDINAEKQSTPSSSKWMRMARIAAMFILLIGAFFLFESNGNNEYVTDFNEMKTLDLPDGSQVVLNSNSKISYAENWATSTDRQVWLEGEAYFKVKRTGGTNGKKFVVHTDDLDVTVLGTQFNVNTHDENTKVVLEEGKVDIAITKENQSQTGGTLSMLPGQKTSFSDDAKKYEVSEVNTEVYTSWKDGTIVFDGTELSELKKLIENNYGYQVIFESKELLLKKIDGKIDKPNLETLLSTLETIFNLQIEKRDKKIIIKS